MNVLFTNAGRRTYIIDYAQKINNVKIFITESDKNSPTFFYKNIKKCLTCKVHLNPSKYLKQVLLFVKKNKIRILIPLSDHDLIILSKNKKTFLKLGCEVIVSSLLTVKRCVSKKLMYEFCKTHKIATPLSIFSNRNLKNINYAVLIKKINGSGGKFMNSVRNIDHIKNLDFKNFFVQKKIFGTEYGVDIFSYKKVNKICIKKKILMRSGETDRSEITDDKKIENFCKKIIYFMKTYGNLDCDIIKDFSGKLFLIDLNPRFGGGYPATHESGYLYLNYLLGDRKFKFPKKPLKIKVSKGISVFSSEPNFRQLD